MVRAAIRLAAYRGLVATYVEQSSRSSFRVVTLAALDGTTERLRGHAQLAAHPSHSIGEIMGVVVAPSERGKGRGEALVRELGEEP